MNIPQDPESIRRVLEQAAAAAFQRAQARMGNLNANDPQLLRSTLEAAATEAVARAQAFEIPQRVNSAFEGPTLAVEEAFIGLWPILKRFFLFWIVGATILLSSIGLYGTFYWVIQPGQAASEPLFFDYSGIANHPAPVCVNSSVAGSSQPSMVLKDYKNSPWAVADFFSKQPQWEAYHFDVVPNARVEHRALTEGRAYFFEIFLELPESQVNRETGMFTVHVDLQSSNGTRLASSVRSARLPHETHWISTIRKTIWLVPMLVGAVHETRVVAIPAFRHFIESSNVPLRYATVTLVMQDKDRQHRDDPLEVAKGDIRIGKELTEFQYMLREWFFTCYIIGTLILSATHVIGLFSSHIFWKKYQKRRQQLQDLADNDPSVGLDLDEAELEGENGPWIDIPVTESATSEPESRQNTINPVVEEGPEESSGGITSTREIATDDESNTLSDQVGVDVGRIAGTETAEDHVSRAVQGGD